MGVDARMQQLLGGQLKFLTFVFCVLYAIASLGAKTVADCQCLIRLRDVWHDQMFTGAIKQLVEAGMQNDNDICGESKQTIGVYIED